jgi:cytochrome c biogenesis protein CcmG/thiol:disulfide interchange protein DsbE
MRERVRGAVDSRKILIIAAVVAAIAAVWLTAAQPWAGDASAGAGSAQSGNDVTLAITGQTLDGSAFDSAQYAGRPVVVNFFASWCPPCNAEAPDLAAFAKAHPGVAFVGVDVNDQLADAKAFVAKYGLSYPIVYDGQGELGQRYGVDGIPTTMFFDKTGKRVDVVVGAMDRPAFEERLKAAL